MSTAASLPGSLPVSSPSRLRRPVAVLLSRFPLITETFILREVVELERQGQPVHLVPLLRESPTVIHPVARPYIRRALYTPFLSGAILRANMHALRRRPLRYLRLLVEVLAGSARSANLLVGTVGIFPKAVYLAERLQAAGVDHVHAHYATHPAMAAYIIKALTGIPYSVTTHAHDIFVHHAMLRRKVQGAAFVRAISRFNRDYLLRLCPAVDPQAVPLIRVGIDSARYGSHVPLPWRGQLRILCVAALKPYKGLPVLLEACSRLREEGVEFSCTLVGGGPLERVLTERIVALGLRDSVRLAGPLPEEDVAQLLRGASVFVLPSVLTPSGQMDGIPVALLEAMAAGVPVIASRLSGIPELVRDRVTGFLVNPGDVDDLLRALRELQRNPPYLARMKTAARRQVERRHCLERCVAELISRFDRCRPPLSQTWVRRLQDLVPGKPVGVVQLQERRDSWVARLRPSPGADEIVVKGHSARAGASRGPTDRARHEFEILSHLARRPKSPKACRVPRAFSCRGNRLVLEAVAGESLEMLLRRARRNGQAGRSAWHACLAAAHRSGRWLRWFQDETSVKGDPSVRLDALTHETSLDLDRVRGLGRSHREAVADRVRKLRSGLHIRSLDLCARHGDFGPGNVLVNEGRVTVIDFEGTGTGLPVEDAGDFLVQVQLYVCYPLLAGRARLLERAFLDGYADGGFHDPMALELGRTVAAVRLLAGPRPGAPFWPARAWRRRWLQRMALGGMKV